MKNRSLEVAGGAVSDTADNIRVPNTVEGDGFVLKVLYERAFQIGV